MICVQEGPAVKHGSAEAAQARELYRRIAPYRRADDRRAWLQLIGTLTTFAVVWALAWWSLGAPYVLTLVLAGCAGLLLMRLMVLQHDLGHCSLFRSRRANEVVGSLLGLLTMVPYHHWRRVHNDHHAHFGNLDRRGPGDVTMLTVGEYRELNRWKRLVYRVHRNPFFTLLVGAPLFFLVLQRWPEGLPNERRQERRSVVVLNVALIVLYSSLVATMGAAELLLVHGPVLWVFSASTVWMFLNQHGFEHTYWEHSGEWDFIDACLDGSSYYRLPLPLAWLTANVGYHHVHHLSPRIPNYHLVACHRALPELEAVPELTIKKSFESATLALWDEDQRCLVPFGTLGGR